MNGPSLALSRRSLGDPATEFPLFPPLTRAGTVGAWRCGTAGVRPCS
ncbi:hypothetical protein [Nonomuraea sp. CA-141351]